MNHNIISRTVHKNTRLGERYTEILHASGLKIFVYPKKCSSTYAILQVGLGSMDAEYLDAQGNARTMPLGTAHYLEHKMFENADGVNSDLRFSALGAECNAFTSYDRTAYLFNTTSNVKACLRELLRFVTHPYFTEESVERERGIIAEEIRGAADHPWERAYAQMIKAMYKQHTVRYEIAGSEQSIAQVTPELLYSCTDTFYLPSNMSLAVCGDVTPAQVLCAVDAELSSEYKQMQFAHKQFKESPCVQSTRAVSYMPVPKPVFYIGLKDVDISADPAERIRKDACMTLLFELIFSMSGKLCSDLYEQGQISYGMYYGYSINERVATGTAAGEAHDPEAVYAAVLAYIEKLKKEGIPQEDFERCKRVEYGNFVAEFDSPENIVNMLLSFADDGSEMLAYPSVMQSVTYELCNEYLHKCFDEKYMCLSVVYPEDKENQGGHDHE
ncbi:MAG: insulinase family protein [Clostridia bacterium]|nr:insulinase family protein [Clostridia bacterium]MBO7296055.1 insulinase family protein [Clostridia bacterium]